MTDDKTKILPLVKITDKKKKAQIVEEPQAVETGEPIDEVHVEDVSKVSDTSSEDDVFDDAFMEEVFGEDEEVSEKEDTAPMDIPMVYTSEPIEILDETALPVRPAALDYAERRMDSPLDSKKNKWFVVAIIAVAAIIIALLIVGSCSVMTHVAETEPTIKQYDETNTMVLESSTYEEKLNLDTTLSVETVSTVKAPSKGEVEEVKVKEGDTVKKGDVLFIVTDKDLNHDLEVAQDELKEAQSRKDAAQAVLDDAASSLGAAQDALTAAQDTLDMIRKVAAEERKTETTSESEDKSEETTGMNMGSSSTSASPTTITHTITVEKIPDSVIQAAESSVTYAESALSRAQTAYDKADAQVKAEQAIVDEAQVKVKDIQTKIDALTVKAAYDGTVTLVNIKSGQIAPDDFKNNENVIEISNVSGAVVNINVSGKDADGFDKSDEVRVYVNDKKLESKIAEISTDGDTISAKIELSDVPSDVRDGDACRVEIVKNILKNTYLVPESALQKKHDGAAQVKLIHDDETTELLTVTVVGELEEGKYGIKSMMLKEGVTIATDLS